MIRKSSYRYETLQPLVFAMLDRFGGRNLSARSRVLIKPNLMTYAAPEGPLDASLVSRPLRNTSWSWRRPLSPTVRRWVLRQILQEAAFRKPWPAERGMPPFGILKMTSARPSAMDIAREAIESDFIINLPSLKPTAR
jgi:hypothetical protein